MATSLEKLNDVTTKYFQHSTNHYDLFSLRQILEKRNRIEILDLSVKYVNRQVCSLCKLPGHNKKTCNNLCVLYITVIYNNHIELYIRTYVWLYYINHIKFIINIVLY